MAEDAKRFGQYQLIRTLGVGGMAQTYKALRFYRIGDAEVTKPVCLKQILPQYNRDEDFLFRFHEEARNSIQLEHPNVVKVTDFGEVEGTHFMELELVEGVDLLRLLTAHGGRLPVDIVKQIALDIASGLQYAHNHIPIDTGGNRTPGTRGIIHRDISPSNILLSNRGNAKLADFGIAKALNASKTAKASRAPLGKVPYMAPERFNKKVPTDGRADLFSLGIVLFECVGGLRPYDGDDDSETIGNIIQGAPQAVAKEVPGIDDALASIIENLIAPDLERRIPDAETLLEQLHEIAPPARTRLALAEMVQGAMSSTANEPNAHKGTDQWQSPEAKAPPDPPSVSEPASSERSHDAENPGAIQTNGAAPESRPPVAPPVVPPVNPWPRRALLAFLGIGGVAIVGWGISKIGGGDPEGPIVTDPGPQTTAEGELVQLQVAAENADRDNETLIFSASDLPPGLRITRRGSIRGKVREDAAGVYNTIVTVDNGEDTTTVEFPWTIEERAAPPPPPPPPPEKEEDAEQEQPPPPPKRGRIKVVVIPWGNAWVDGKQIKPGTYRKVSPGLHIVKAGKGELGAATKTRKVTVGAGKSIKVEIQL